MRFSTENPRSESIEISSLNADCPGRAVLDHLTCRWGLVALLALEPSAKRFHRLRDEIDGISEKMLSQTLKLLERDGLLTRTADKSVPPKVTYELTALGQEVTLHLQGLIRWIGARMGDIQSAHKTFDEVHSALRKVERPLSLTLKHCVD